MRPRGLGAERGLDDAATSLRASQVFIALCAPALLLLAVAVVVLVPQILHPGTVPVVLGAGVLAQPVAALAVLQHRRTLRPQSWWSVWATLVIAVLTLCVRDPAFRQEAVMALVVGPLYAAMFTSIRSMLLHLALAGGTASSLVLAIPGDPLVRMARVLAVDMVLAVTVSGFFILRRRLDAALHRAVTALERADHLAAHDPLTGLLNRRGLSAALEVAPGGAPDPDPSTTGAVLLDIDHFKRINDTLGHQTGDEVLCRVAAVLARTVRPGDLVARVGGEEFFVVVPGTDLADVAALAERLRNAVSADVDGPTVTVSAGVAATTAHASGSLDDLYGRADRLLYRAKVEGRDRVCVEAA